jgi:PAS domain S-box-containing protein
MTKPATPSELTRRIAALEDELADCRRRQAADRQTVTQLRRLADRFDQAIFLMISDMVDEGIGEALKLVGEFTGAGRSHIFRFKQDTAVMVNTHEWCAEGVAPRFGGHREMRIDRDLPVFARTVRSQEIVIIPDVVQLPEEAATDRRYYQAHGVGSLVAVPMKARNKLVGAIGAESLGDAAGWSRDHIHLLKIMAQMITNVLAREQVKDNLRDSQQRYQDFIDNAPIGIFTLDADGRFVYGNQKLAAITGYGGNSWRETLFETMIAPDDLPLVEQLVRDRLEGRGSDAPYEIRAVHAGGRIIWIRINSETLYEKDDDGATHLSGVLAFVEEVTGRKAAEAALRVSERRFRDMAELLPETIFEADADGRLTFVNRKGFELFGIEAEDLSRGVSVYDMLRPADRPRARQSVARILAGEDVGLTEYTACRPDGTPFPVLFHSAAVLHADQPTGIRGFVVDMTREKRLEAEVRKAHKMEAVGTLSGGIAHEFNNILGIILGFSEMGIDDVDASHPAHGYLKEIYTASLRGKAIVEQLLSFCRKAEETKKPISIGDVLNDSVRLLKAGLPEIVHFSVNAPPELPRIDGDYSQVQQLIVNLSKNAADAMKAQPGHLSISLAAVDLPRSASADPVELPDGRYVKLSVADTGGGIPPEHLDRVFDPFYTTKAVGEGSGMGLAVVHGIVEAHGGTIQIDSRQGRGTTVAVYFPALPATAATEADSAPAPQGGSERLLLLDDEMSLVILEKMRLERVGYQVDGFDDPFKALAAFCEAPGRYDLVIVDLAMPKMDGRTFISRIKARQPEIRTILCTGSGDNVTDLNLEEIGAVAVVSKPTIRNQMAAAVRSAIDD